MNNQSLANILDFVIQEHAIPVAVRSKIMIGFI